MPRLRRKHQDNIDQRSFLCIEENCDRSVPGNGFATKSGTAAHWKKQHATNCEKCSLEFTSPEILKEHRKKAHSAIACPENFCPRNSITNGFRLESQLKSHKESCHKSFSAFPCATILADRTICLSSFSGIKMLREHKSRVHRAKSHLCTQEFCPRSISGNGFKLKPQLKLHLRTHLRSLGC
jgi:hypothetical protein